MSGCVTGMSEKSYDNLLEETLKSGSRTQHGALPMKHRIGMLVINYIPLLHILLLVGVLFVPWGRLLWKISAGLACLYILPPIVARLIRAVANIQEGRIEMGSHDFFGWWLLLNLQVIFCRLPWLEEILRLVPGFYSAWLRLWGARIGRLTYWAAGTLILDRPFLDIGDDVIFGAGVRLNAHVLTRNEMGKLELLLGTIKIGSRAIVGGYSLITAGSEIAADETTKAFLKSPPFSRWENGRRFKPDADF